MLSDLSALAPPLLVCAAFLVGVWAFIRHEMRQGDKQSPDKQSELSDSDPIPGAGGQNPNAVSGRSAEVEAGQAENAHTQGTGPDTER